MITESDYQQDLAFLRDKLLCHPLCVIHPETIEKFDVLYRKLGKTERYDQFIDAMTYLTSFFHDGHTNIELPYTESDLCLNIPCSWCGDRLFLSGNYEGIEQGSEIISVEGWEMATVMAHMEKRIPHENRYLVKSRMTHYPYRNYHFFSQMNLRSMFGDRETYCVNFLSNGRCISRSCALQAYDRFLDFPKDETFLSWELSDTTAVLHLDACICNDAYKAALRELAEQCRAKKIKRFVLDLGRNMGGSSAVIDEFVRYVDIDTFKRYEMIDCSQGMTNPVTRRDEVIKNRKYPVCFPRELYCRVSNDTFSSARTFAVTLRDNGIARIIGEPTGGRPNSFGMPKRFQTPNSGIRFRVSTSLFLRPNPAGDSDIALYPDM